MSREREGFEEAVRALMKAEAERDRYRQLVEKIADLGRTAHDALEQESK